jgi:hypothetical protein
MKKISLLFFCFISALSFALSPSLDSARSLAQDDIIVTPSIPQYHDSAYSEKVESSLYRLDDRLIRQEALSVALKLKGVAIPDSYSCQ